MYELTCDFPTRLFFDEVVAKSGETTLLVLREISPHVVVASGFEQIDALEGQRGVDGFFELDDEFVGRLRVVALLHHHVQDVAVLPQVLVLFEGLVVRLCYLGIVEFFAHSYYIECFRVDDPQVEGVVVN